MDLGTILLIVAALVLVALVSAFFAVSFMGGRRKTRVRELLHDVLTSSQAPQQPTRRKKLSAEDIENLKKTTSTKFKKGTQTIQRPGSESGRGVKLESSKFFQAGLFTLEDRKSFRNMQIFSPIIAVMVSMTTMYLISAPPLIMTLGFILGLFTGLSLPQTWLDRKIDRRTEEIRYFLPLVIEQISIGVSSSLDIWPCISNILDMARSRNTHNPVTELFVYVEKLIASGLNLQDALAEVSTASGVQQIKHTFRYLGQVAEHGGEVSKQLQELADAVMSEHQTSIEGKIHSLPVKATGPLFLVFSGFFIIMLAGMFVKLMMSFPGQ